MRFNPPLFSAIILLITADYYAAGFSPVRVIIYIVLGLLIALGGALINLARRP